MFDQSLLPSSFQTPTASITSQSISSFQQESIPKLYPYSNNHSNQAQPQNVNSSEVLGFQKRKQPHEQQLTHAPSSFVNSQKSAMPENNFIYNVLPPLQPIVFNPGNWDQKPSTPAFNIPSFNIPTLNGLSNQAETSTDKMDQMRKDNFDLYFQNRNLKEELGKLKQQHETLVIHSNKVTEQLDSYKKDIDRSKILESINANLKMEISMVFDQLRNQKNKVEALEREIQGLRVEIRRYEEFREKDKIAYKNLLGELHVVKSQMDNIKKVPNEIFKSVNQGRLIMLEQERRNKIQYLEKLKHQLNNVKEVVVANQNDKSRSHYAIIGLENQIKEIKDQNKRRESSKGSRRTIKEDQTIRGMKQEHEEELNRLRREINKKALQAQRLNQELTNLGE